MAVTNSQSIYNDNCIQCMSFDPTSGVCSKIHENIKINPQKIQSKCGGKFFELDSGKMVQNKPDENILEHVDAEGQAPKESADSIKSTSGGGGLPKWLVYILILVVINIILAAVGSEWFVW